MKILLVTQTFPLSPNDSTAHFMYDFARGFVLSGHQVSVVLPFHPDLNTRSFQKSGIKLFPFKYIWPDRLHLLGFGRTLKDDQELPRYVYIISPLYYLFDAIKLYRIVRKIHPQVINAHWLLPNGFIAAAISLFTGIPTVTTIPGSDAYIARQNIPFRFLAKFAAARSHRIISNSPLLLKDLGLSGSIISYPVPKNYSHRIKNRHPVIATAGRNVQKKGFEILKKIVPDIEIISGLTINQFRRKLLAVDVFIGLSIRDQKGNLDDASLTVLEAMAAGCAVIASDLPGYRSIIKGKTNGYLVNPRDPAKIKRLVNILKSSPRLRLKIGKNARQTISRSFTPEKIAQSYLKIFQTLTPK